MLWLKSQEHLQLCQPLSTLFGRGELTSTFPLFPSSKESGVTQSTLEHFRQYWDAEMDKKWERQGNIPLGVICPPPSREGWS